MLNPNATSWDVSKITTPEGHYIPAIQEIIIRHLAICSAKAAKGVAREEEMFGNIPDSVMPKGRLLYWRHVQQAAKLFAHDAKCKQAVLLAMSEHEQERVRSEWNQQTKT